jgi:hypothetical protein
VRPLETQQNMLRKVAAKKTFFGAIPENKLNPALLYSTNFFIHRENQKIY